MTLRRRLLFEWLLIAIAAMAAVLLATQWRGTAAFDHLFYDQLSSVARPKADADILLITIDDRSLKELGKWPWTRDTHAKLISRVQSAKPRAILFDILVSENGNAEHDQALAQSMVAGPAPLFIPLHFITPGSDGRDYDVAPPVDIFTKASAGIGHVNVEFDSDGTVRRALLCVNNAGGGSGNWPHIVELIYRNKGEKASPAFSRVESCDNSVLIPYSERGSFQEISYIDILNGEVPAELIQNKDIIIGATAIGMGDNYPAPFGDGGLLSGSEIMANMLGAMRRDDFIQPLSFGWTALLSLLPLWILLVGFLRWRPRIALIASISLVAAILFLSALLLQIKIWFPPGAALLGILLIYPLWGWRRLQAVSDFMAHELGDLQKDGDQIPLPLNSSRSGDLVERQSSALAAAIDHMRDLRRFVVDALEDLPDPMVVTDNQGTITLSNSLIEERLGHSLVGQSITKLLDDIVQPQQRPLVDSYLKSRAQDAALEEDKAPEFVRFQSQQGRSFVMRTANIFSDNGIRRGQIHYLADITALAEAEAGREEALQLLSHDMRAPQSAIIALLPELTNKKASERIEGHARRTMQMAQDFVQIARMGESEFEGEDVLLADMAQEIADNFWPLAKERKISINVVAECDDGFVFAEPDPLSRAISNLLDNAIKYSPDGGTITMQVERTKAADGQAMLSFSISDEGGGIDAELLPTLFTRFAMGRQGKARVKGSGLGLSFVRAVAERHSGSVTAENLKQGSRFTLTLPEAIEPPVKE